MLPSSWLLAQAAQQEPAPDGSAFLRMMVPMLVIFALFYFMLIRPQKKKEQELREKVGNLKENDRVVTIGGIYGVVTNVKRDAEQVTIRVDETTGTKLRMSMSAISRVLSAEDSESGGAASNKS